MIQFVIDHTLLTYLAAGLKFAAISSVFQRWILPLHISATAVSRRADDLVAHFGPLAAEVTEIEQDYSSDASHR
jgi:hypothetical protein